VEEGTIDTKKEGIGGGVDNSSARQRKKQFGGWPKGGDQRIPIRKRQRNLGEGGNFCQQSVDLGGNKKLTGTCIAKGGNGRKPKKHPRQK